MSVIDVGSGVYMHYVCLPAGSGFSVSLLVGPGRGAVAAWLLNCQIQHDMFSPNRVVYNYRHWVVSVTTWCFCCLLLYQTYLFITNSSFLFT